jgi:hypothetical protein
MRMVSLEIAQITGKTFNIQMDFVDMIFEISLLDEPLWTLSAWDFDEFLLFSVSRFFLFRLWEGFEDFVE